MVKTYSMLLFACVAWGVQPVFIKWLVAEWTPETITVARYMIVTVLWLILAWRKDGKAIMPQGRNAWLCLAAMGFFGILLNNVLQFAGLQYTTVTNCTLIASTQPAVTACMAFFLIRERLSAVKWLGIFISFAGVLAVVSNGSWEVIRQIDFNIGDILCFIAQMAWAVYMFFSLQAMRRLSPEAATLWFCFFGGIMTAVWSVGSGTLNLSPLSGMALVSFLYVMFIGGFLSLFFYNVGVKNAGPSVAAIFLNIMPVVGMVSGYLAFGDIIGVVQLGGAAAILLGVFLTTHKRNRLYSRN